MSEKPPFPKVTIAYPLEKVVSVYLRADNDHYSTQELVMTCTQSDVCNEQGELIGSFRGDCDAPILHFFIGRRCWTVNGVQLFEAVLAADKEYLKNFEERAGAS